MQLARPRANPEIKKKMHAEFMAARVKWPRREVTHTLPGQLMIALLVKNGRDPRWGAVKGYEIHQGTPNSIKDEYKEELKKAYTGWMINGYFGADAQFKIDEYKTEPRKYTYLI